MWERFSYYGMRALLTGYMTATLAAGGLGFDNKKAGVIYGLYTSSAYFLPIIGGWLADNVLGARRAVLIGGFIIMCGHIALAFASMSTFFVGLLLVALGTGFLKSNVSTMVGGLYGEKDARRDAGFSIFYMGINLGAFIAPIVCGQLREGIGWHFAFGAAAIGMAAGLVQYVLGTRNLQGVGELPQKQALAAGERAQGSMSPVSKAIMAALIAGVVYLAYAKGVDWLYWMPCVILTALVAVLLIGVDAKLSGQEWKRIGMIFILFFFSALFWMGFEQAGSSLTLFARDLTNNTIAGKAFAFENYQAINSIFIIIFAPVFAAIWLKLGSRKPSDFVKFAIALLFAGLGFLVMTYASSLTGGGKVSPFWLIFYYLLATFGELCLSPVGLSAMTKLAPAKMVGLMMGVWFLSISLGNFFAGVVGGEFQIKPEVLVGLFGKVAALTAAGGILLLVLSPFIQRFAASAEATER
jgi:POT family proton-dependent oligopeptide transporter